MALRLSPTRTEQLRLILFFVRLDRLTGFYRSWCLVICFTSSRALNLTGLKLPFRQEDFDLRQQYVQ